MNQTIEQMREQGFKDLQRENYGDLDDYDNEGLFHAGAAWEHNRTKWSNAYIYLPGEEGGYLIEWEDGAMGLCDFRNGSFQCSGKVAKWAEIPL